MPQVAEKNIGADVSLRGAPHIPAGGGHTLRAAGPFDLAPREEELTGLGNVVVTGLLVIYPALAIVAAVVVGLRLSGAGA